jgi:glycosyltransferase involved in cell wall biosynthesis
VKINFILPFYSVRPIGGLKVAYEYANQLVAWGHQVSVIHPRSMRNIAAPASRLRQLQAAVLDARNLFAPRAGLSWQPVDERVGLLIVPEPTARYVPDADVVVATAWQTSEYVRDYPAQKGAKFYLVMDFDPWIAPAEVLAATWLTPAVKVTISSWLRDKVVAAGCGPSEVVNIPIGINFDQFGLDRAIENREQQLLMMFSSAPNKGSEIGLAAITKVRESHPDLKVILFGPTMRRRPAGLPPWAEYFGNVSADHLRTLYNESRIYVCSSWAEGFALPPAEAMACGCAVAATDCGGIREFAADGSNSLLSAAGDVEALAGNINRLIGDDLLRIKLAMAGHNSIQSFTWDAAATKLAELMNDCVAESRKPEPSLAAHG